MAYHFNDNVYTKSFTPREYQVELLDAAKERNIIVCLGSAAGKIFIATKLIQELASIVRKPWRGGGKRTLYVVDTPTLVAQQAAYIRHLTDLSVGEYVLDTEEEQAIWSVDWETELQTHQVLVMTSTVCFQVFRCGFLSFVDINLIVLDECHRAVRNHPVQQIMRDFDKCRQRPRVLGLTAPLLNNTCDPARLEGEIRRLEISLHSTAETASDIVSVLSEKESGEVTRSGPGNFSGIVRTVMPGFSSLGRYCARPKEVVVEYGLHVAGKLDFILEQQVQDAISFINDHRYDPSEVYDEEFQEELKGIPDPKIDPIKIFDEFLNVLHTLGPWCADRAALVLLIHLEKLKVKTPYERHFLLLCMVSSVMVKIRAICDDVFQEYDDRDRIYNFSSPKVLRVLEVLKQFKPAQLREDKNSVACLPENDSKDPKPLPSNGESVNFKSDKQVAADEVSSLSSKSDIMEKKEENCAECLCEDQSTLVSETEECSASTEETLQLVVNNISPPTMLEVNSLPEEIPLVETCNSETSNCSNSDCQSKTLANESDLKVCDHENTDCDNKNCSHIPNSAAILLTEKVVNQVSQMNGVCSNKLININSDEEQKDLTNEKSQPIETNSETKNEISEKKLGNSAEASPTKSTSSVNKTADNSPKRENRQESSFHGQSRGYTGRGKGPRFNRRFFREDASGKNGDMPFRHYRNLMQDDADALCGIVFVEQRFTAKILYHLLNDIRRCDEDFSFLAAQYTVDKIADPVTDPREAEIEHRKQEEVLKRFRMRECNLLVGTSVLEEGIDVPKCNLVILFDPPLSYRSYVQCKGRARAQDAHFVLLVAEDHVNQCVHDLAQYYEIEQMLLRKCANREPPEDEEQEADKYSDCIEAYSPINSPSNASVNMATAVTLVNRYCAKLPSDTFTRLTPMCSTRKVRSSDQTIYICTVRLPINSPVKQDIVGLPMPTRVLARRIAALEACRILHKARELDDNLLPVGKEGFRVPEEEEELASGIIADALTDCRPTPGQPAFLYYISMVLTCPLPEEQNTRGRKIYPPEDSMQGFGILTLKEIPKICPFPIFTRSGEVRVKLELTETQVLLTEEKIEKIVAFLNYTFTSVLRLQKYLMMFDPQASENSYFIIPTKKEDKDSPAEVDWDFLDRIYENRDLRPRPVPQEERANFAFDPVKYHDAVIMPWYRNQDQPQYFYVAEICGHLNPKSSFPGSEYKTFDEYYFKKYNIQIQNSKQPLLDVDHTSARLNFLTPRYVNRKGVALPTSSEETKRAKRENLEQKQILVPELCTVHPFPASLWRKAVCLPCVLYRVNALLLADQIRCQVAASVGLGRQQLSNDFEWPPLDFGWSLADVLKKSKENAAKNALKEKGEPKESSNDENSIKADDDNIKDKVEKQDGAVNEDNSGEEDKDQKQKSANEILTEEEKKLQGDWMEIGTWSNEMANQQPKTFDLPIDDFDPNVALPSNLTLLGEDDELMQLHAGGSDWGTGICARRKDYVRYGSPSSWMGFGGMGGGFGGMEQELDGFESDDSYSEQGNDFDQSDSSDLQGTSGLRIEFKSDNVAEAVEDEQEAQKRERRNAVRSSEANGMESDIPWDWDEKSKDEDEDEELEDLTLKYQQQFENATKTNEELIHNSGILLNKNESLTIARKSAQGTQVPSVFVEVMPQKLDRRHIDLTQPLTHNQEADFIAGEFIIFKSLKSVGYDQKQPNADSGISEDEMSRTSRTDPLGSDSEDLMEMDEWEGGDEETDIISKFSFDAQPDLNGHAGPSPSIILQALTMSNANDGINLERLETIGDSFLKYAITTYLYCTYDNIHEGKLSHLRSKQVSNLNLYRLGRRKVFGESMIATKFEPHDNWLPPCYYVPRELEQALIEAGVPASHWNRADLPALREMTRDEICALVRERGEQLRAITEGEELTHPTVASALLTAPEGTSVESLPCFIPYNLITQHSIPDKSVADCVEALIGAYLIACGPRGALLFMAWLGICVLPKEEVTLSQQTGENRKVGSLPEVKTEEDGNVVWKQVQYGSLKAPRSPLLRHVSDPEGELNKLLDGYEAFEKRIGYRFRDRSYLLQALTHASYSPNRLTDCYQRLEFLGDAVLDYLITRHLYEDSRQHSPGALTDLRSALVNNTIFASLAVRHGFHKFFRHLSPGLNDVVDRFVRIQEENGHTISEEYYLIEEEECEEAEDVEVPKALGDVFESVAGAIFLDSNMSLDAVWRVYYRMMKGEIEQFSTNVPKSPIRELLELEPETAKFGKPEKLADGRRVRVTVEVFGKGTFKGIGRNYRIAKCTAAKCALKQLKKKGLLSRKM
ncbi:Endoribonuclease Dcr-1 [Gryllus bimaculatus]|nr:Endoribonuclease Dcr-1 [Gryllus bimaculatus]